jgi:hypothetical protein
MNQGITGNDPVKGIPVNGRKFARQVDDASFKIQNRDVLNARLFLNPLFGFSWQGKFARVIFQDNLPDGSEAQVSLFMWILKGLYRLPS